MSIPTPHIEALSKDDFAKVVLMPGDPLRAEYIAQRYLTDVKIVNKVRNMFGFTGYYKGHKVTVMGSGMGQPSIGIYSYELFKFYDVDMIIRIGSAGSYVKELNVYDVVIVDEAYSESNYAAVAFGNENHTLKADKKLVSDLENAAKHLGYPVKVGKTHSSDVFYREHGDIYKDVVNPEKVLCVEMESFALFANAQALGKKAACVLTISDSFVTHEVTTSEERHKKLNQMIEIALETAFNE